VDLHVGQKFGEYEIIGLLEVGGMGPMYKVEHCLTKRTEAMKVLPTELATESQIKRFERELRVLARLSHPNIAVLYNALHSENQLILLMEFIDGQTLESMLSAGRLPLDTGIGYIRQILLAIRYVHQQGVVHRDITPANVMITTAGEVKLSDFGLSKAFSDSLLTNCGEILGALPYLAPEQVKGATHPDRRSDLYSVGAILYELLTGQKPFGANRKLAPVLTDSEGDPQPPSQLEPSLSPQWDNIIRHALARDPRHRYQSADEFLGSIAQLEQSVKAEFSPAHKGALGIGLAIVTGLILALVALPAIHPFHPALSAIMPMHTLHIPPPAFATSTTVFGKQTALRTTPPLAKPAQKHGSKRAAEASVFEPPPPAQTSNHDPAEPTSSPELTVPTANVGQDVNQASAPEQAEVGVSPAPTQKKRTLWNKLNVFKKKSLDTKEKQ
jgi:serine/threonine-protein kinase